MVLTPRGLRNFRKKLRVNNSEKYNVIERKDREYMQKIKLTLSSQRKGLERRKNLEKVRKLRLSLSFSKEIEDEVKSDFEQNKSPKAFLPSLKKNKRVFNAVSEAIASTPVRTPLWISESVKNKNPLKGTNNIAFTPVRASLRISESVKKKKPLKEKNNIAFTPLRQPLRISESVKKKKPLKEKNKLSLVPGSENVNNKKVIEEKIKQFFVKHTWVCRRDKRLKIKPQVLMIPLKYLFKAFCDENPDLHVSMQKFCSLKPPKLQIVNTVNFNAFLSIYGGNSKIIISEILKVCVGLPKQLRNLMSLNICDPYKDKCISSACKKCSYYGKICSTNEIEEKIKLSDDHSIMKGTHTKMNIIERFVIGDFTPPPDLKPLQFHEVSRVLQTRLQESNKNIHIVKIIEKANKSPILQILVEKTIKKQTGEYKENQTEEKVVSKDETKKTKKKETVAPKELKAQNNDNEGNQSKKNKKEPPKYEDTKNTSNKRTSPKDEINKMQLEKQIRNQKSNENETDDIPKSMNRESKKGMKEAKKSKVAENNQSTEKKNTRAKKNDTECVQAQTGADQKQSDDELGNKIGEDTNKRKRNSIIHNVKRNITVKSNGKKNEEHNKNIVKRGRGRPKKQTNEKTESILKCLQPVENCSSELQTAVASKSESKGKNDSAKVTNSKERKDTDNMHTSDVNDDTISEVSSTLDKTLHEHDESFSLNKTKRKPKPRTRIVLNPLEKKIKERRQSKITTFLAAEKGLDKSAKNVSKENKSSTEAFIPSMEEYTSDKVLPKSKEAEKYFLDDLVEKSSKQNEPNEISVSKKNFDKEKLKRLKKVRRSIVNELNNSALIDLDSDMADKVEKDNGVQDNKISSKANPKSNDEDILEELSNNERNTVTKTQSVNTNTKKAAKVRRSIVNELNESALNDSDTDVVDKVPEENVVVNTKANPTSKNKKVSTEPSKKSTKSIPKSNKEENSKKTNNKGKAESNTLQSDDKKIKKAAKVRRSIVNELNKSALNNDLDTDVVDKVNEVNLVSDSQKSSKTNLKTNNKKKSKEPIKKVSVANSKSNNKEISKEPLKSKTEPKTLQTDDKKIKKAAKVRRSIVNELNDSALNDLDIDVVDKVDKENKVSGRKRPSKANAKSNMKDTSEEPLSKKRKTETKTLQSDNQKTKKGAKTKTELKTKQSNSKKQSQKKETTKPAENHNRAAAEAKARELLMPEDCPITANLGTMKYLEQRSTLLKAIDNQRESDGDIFSSNIFKKKSGMANLLESDNVDDTFAIRTPQSKGGTTSHDGGVSPFTPRTGMFADWASLANTSTAKTPIINTLPTPTVDTEHKKVVMQVTYHMQKNKRRGIRKLATTAEEDDNPATQPKKNNKKNSLLDLPNMTDDCDLDDLGDDYFF
ncbi:unnamed protein product [Meganyctiphanes norvegica]|uniref:Uncharacterized protein n=1 Tax=Meganyctiphanes norvegica TaxID=48144 RepID=A0AAV2R930_MEGNR